MHLDIIARIARPDGGVCTYFLVTLVNLLLQLRFSGAVEFPNNIVGTPRINCGEMEIEMSVETANENPSHMFVIGRHEEPACVTRNTNQIVIMHESCGMNRERSLSPAGIMYRVCISIQLHPQFVTKVDRTYCARCFYTEGVNELTRILEVSPQSSTEIPVAFDAPVCTYSIRKGSPTGAEIRYATVGEPVYHVWHCPSEMNGMLVQNCYVEDGAGNRILIIDQNGCGIDQYVMQTPDYTRDLTMAFQESHVFKFADKTITRFTCQIKICIKANNGCGGITPPDTKCALQQLKNAAVEAHEAEESHLSLQTLRHRQRRLKRALVDKPYDLGIVASEFKLRSLNGNRTKIPIAQQIRQLSEGETMELDVSDELIVLDDPSDELHRYLREEFDSSGSSSDESRPGLVSFPFPHDRVCVPRQGATLMLVISTAFGLFGVILVIYLLKVNRLHQKRQRMQSGGGGKQGSSLSHSRQTLSLYCGRN